MDVPDSFPTKATLTDIDVEYVVAFIVIVILTLLVMFVVCLGLGYLFCSRKKRSEFNKDDSKVLAKGQVTLRGITSGRYNKPLPILPVTAASVVDQTVDEVQETEETVNSNQLPQLANPVVQTTLPPTYHYPMHLLFGSNDDVVDDINMTENNI